ncbi:MAG: hypothetical protein K6E19_10570 [Lachnospiraceae bacterium]|nr:hypothetical protein [Lachnospiraceae bacterium]
MASAIGRVMIYWIISTILALYIKGLCGFADTLVFTSILSFGNANINNMLYFYNGEY